MKYYRDSKRDIEAYEILCGKLVMIYSSKIRL